MAFLFATSFYLFTFLFYSISCSFSIGRSEGFKAAAPSFGDICKRFNYIRSQKLICLFCKGLDPSCLIPSSTTQHPSTPITSTTVASITVPSTSTDTSTPASTTVPTTTPTTEAPPE